MGWRRRYVFTDETTDLRPSNAAAMPFLYNVSPEYFHAAGTALLAGRGFTWHDDKNAPRVAVVNREFARKIFGSVDRRHRRALQAAGWNPRSGRGHCRRRKIYYSLTEDPQPAMFLPILQSPSQSTLLVVRSNRDPQQLAAAIRRHSCASSIRTACRPSRRGTKR